MMHATLAGSFLMVENVDFSPRSARSCITKTDCVKDSHGANQSCNWFFFKNAFFSANPASQ